MLWSHFAICGQVLSRGFEQRARKANKVARYLAGIGFANRESDEVKSQTRPSPCSGWLPVLIFLWLYQAAVLCLLHTGLGPDVP